MQFELTEALIGDLLFSMEDQMGEFFLDTQEGVIIGENDNGFAEALEDESEDRYISLPTWDSSDGFRLMEHFTAGLRNPVLRNELAGALNRGKGVFRAFKDILSRYPETEKLWFSYKERGMKREILRWYNGLREEWGLERSGGEPEDTGDLVLEDFRFRPLEENDREAAEALHRHCADELRDHAAEQGLGTAGFLAGDDGYDETAWVFPGDLALAAETGGGEFAGYIAALRQEDGLRVYALEVRPTYRGLGIGETLLARFLEQAKTPDAKAEGFHILIDLPAGSNSFSPVLFRNAFKPYAIRYCLLA
jgi:GNAT superfamily N-acetyltransferase